MAFERGYSQAEYAVVAERPQQARIVCTLYVDMQQYMMLMIVGRLVFSRDTKISALEKKLALMEAERASSAGPSASEGEGDGENDAKPSSSSAPKPKALEKPSTLPAKPAAATIREGEMLEAKEEREKEMGGSNRRHGAKAKEAPRPSTLVGLNASMRD